MVLTGCGSCTQRQRGKATCVLGTQTLMVFAEACVLCALLDGHTSSGQTVTFAGSARWGSGGGGQDQDLAQHPSLSGTFHQGPRFQWTHISGVRLNGRMDGSLSRAFCDGAFGRSAWGPVVVA